MLKSDAWTRDPFALGVALIAVITAYRLALLPLATADLFVDETQYWQWGQALDWGYYSKPPLIGWVIRAVTDLAGSDSAFWIRMPGAVFHAVTALLIMGVTSEIGGRTAGVFAGLAYVTMPFASVGSFLISTDTILLPFFAASLWVWLRLGRESSAFLAILLGLCLGLGFLAKYAAIYFWMGAAIGAALIPQARIAWRDLSIAAAVFALVISPNIYWNLANDLVTLSHTADNADWVGRAFQLHPDRAAGFLGTQFGVMGPVLFAAYLWAAWVAFRGDDWRAKFLLAMSAPIILLVLGQAFLSRAYANWAVTAYVAATVLTVVMLAGRARWVLILGIALNLVVAVAIPVAAIGADRWTAPGSERLLLRRFVGRSALSARILAEAEAAGADVIVAAHRDVLADLFHAARETDIAVFSVPHEGAAGNYYAQEFPVPDGIAGTVLYAAFDAPPCGGELAADWTAGPAYRNAMFAAYVVAPDCWGAP